MAIVLNLVVLKSPAPAELAAFYGAAGLGFAYERHGDGPGHFAAALAQGGVIELYPANAPGRTTFGLRVDDRVAFTTAWLAAGGRTGRDPGVLIDPEGNILVLSGA
jgi:hypothetical protein